MRKKDEVASTIQIRRAKVADARSIHDAHMKSICEVCAKDYTPKQIAAWGGRKYDFEVRRRAIERDCVWVVELNGQVQGFGHLKRDLLAGHEVAYVSALYLAPEVIGKGAGKGVLKEMEKTALAWGFHELFLESTITSLGFYKKNGFVENGPRYTCLINSEEIPCHPMKKVLDR